MIRLAVTGAAGRMGRTIIQAIQATPNTELACAIERENSAAIGTDAGDAAGVGHLGVPVESDWSERKFDVLIEFTGPEATLDHARNCLDAGGRMVIGTTGLSDSDKCQITALSENMTVVMAPNMSVG